MPGRQTILATGENYHIFNRGNASQPTFLNKKDYQHFLETLGFYIHHSPPLRLSKFSILSKKRRHEILKRLSQKENNLINIFCFCLMPNHFHLLGQQSTENGISKFMSQIQNSYTKYFNTKRKRIGSLLQGQFKAKRIETEEQLIHVSRYIHLNPYSSFIVKSTKQLKEYPVVILGNAVCLSKDNAEELTNYVSEGGILFACGQAGKLDDLGYPHKEPVLDKLLGIQKRQPVPEKWIDNRVSLLFLDEKLKEDDCPYLTLRGMEEFVFPKENVNLLAKIREFPSARSPLDKALPTWPEEAEKFAGGLWIKQVEKGFVIYTPLQIFTTYLKFPATRAVRIFKKLFTSLVTPAITLAGPLAVRVNTRILPDGKWAVHLHNNPGSAYLYPAPPYSNGLRFPGEVSPAYDLKIFVHRRKVKSACSGLTGKFFKVSNNQVEISELKLHEVVLLETN